jgi:GNAT superfamily N-acetyltransferase
MIVRRELPADADTVRALFSNVSSATFFDKLHADEAWLPALSFIALRGDSDVVGHVAATRGQVGSAPALAQVPPSVDPTKRGQGVGQALMHAVLGAAEALGEPLVGIVAIPSEYLQSTRGELLRRLGRTEEARDAYRRGLALVHNGAERRLLERRLAELGRAIGPARQR